MPLILALLQVCSSRLSLFSPLLPVAPQASDLTGRQAIRVLDCPIQMSFSDMASNVSYPLLTSSRRSILQKSVSDYLSSSSDTTLSKPLKILWSSGNTWPLPKRRSTASKRPFSIAVLDSSFNPPTSAHLSLLLNHPKVDSRYDAHLLIFSTLNADKGTGKKGDASTLQRIEMMEILAKEAVETLQQRSGNPSHDQSGQHEIDTEDGEEASIAIGIVDQPLIATKSTLIHQYLKDCNFDPQSQNVTAEDGDKEKPRAVLEYIVGSDTLPRFFTPRYYDPPDGSGLRSTCENLFQNEKTKLICARRLMIPEPNAVASEELERKRTEEMNKERELLNSEHVKKWYDGGFIEIHDLLSNEEMQFSSTEIRNLVKLLLDGDAKDKGQENSRQRLTECTVQGIRDYVLKERVYRNE